MPTTSLVMKFTESQVREAVENSVSVAGVMRYLGVRWSGGQQTLMKSRIWEYGIDTSHFTGQAHKKGKPDPKRLSASDILVRRESHRRQDVRLLRRALDEISREHCCEICQLRDIWNGSPLVLQIDHIDGDWCNDQAENLRYLCPNCHSQTETFSARKST